MLEFRGCYIWEWDGIPWHEKVKIYFQTAVHCTILYSPPPPTPEDSDSKNKTNTFCSNCPASTCRLHIIYYQLISYDTSHLGFKSFLMWPSNVTFKHNKELKTDTLDSVYRLFDISNQVLNHPNQFYEVSSEFMMMVVAFSLVY